MTTSPKRLRRAEAAAGYAVDPEAIPEWLKKRVRVLCKKTEKSSPYRFLVNLSTFAMEQGTDHMMNYGSSLLLKKHVETRRCRRQCFNTLKNRRNNHNPWAIYSDNNR